MLSVTILPKNRVKIFASFGFAFCYFRPLFAVRSPRLTVVSGGFRLGIPVPFTRFLRNCYVSSGYLAGFAISGLFLFSVWRGIWVTGTHSKAH
jgi:hypothetical protein